MKTTETLRNSLIPIFFGTTIAQLISWNWGQAFICIALGYFSCVLLNSRDEVKTK